MAVLNAQPIKIREFSQGDLMSPNIYPGKLDVTMRIMYERHKRNRLFSPVIERDVVGLCNGLVSLWCEYKHDGKDLMAELTAPELNAELLSKIRRTQLSSGLGSAEFESDDSSDFRDEISDLKKVGYKIEDPGGKREASIVKIGNLECSEAVVVPNLSLEKFESKLDALKENAKLGEPAIVVIGKDEVGHAIAWKYCEDPDPDPDKIGTKFFVLFEPNHGELYFENFEQFKTYLCHFHLPELGNHIGGIHSIETTDLYFPEDKITFLPR